MNSKTLVFVLIMAFLFSCNNKEEEILISPEYKKEINDWHQKRIDNLKKETGWLNLVGLYWLDEGENTFGSSDKNKIIFPSKAPEKLGNFIKN
ncbi:MAG: hypothetical protein KDC90_17670, partial [Ignavibacteriae bacterium]|nr:hypothetical protein [Ignavibacteriota bacterium]